MNKSTEYILFSYKFRWAWLIDATVRYPMQTVKSNCGNMTGIVGNEVPRDKSNEYDAWCHKG